MTKNIDFSTQNAIYRIIRCLFAEKLLDQNKLKVLDENIIAYTFSDQNRVLHFYQTYIYPANTVLNYGDIFLIDDDKKIQIKSPNELIQLLRNEININLTDDGINKFIIDVENSIHNDRLARSYRTKWRQTLSANMVQEKESYFVNWVRGHYNSRDASIFIDQWGSLEGHPYYPTWKSRPGLQDKEVESLSPEFGAEVEVVVGAIRSDMIYCEMMPHVHDIRFWFAENFSEIWQKWCLWLSNNEESSEKWVPMFIHPWHLDNWVVKYFNKEIKNKILLPYGPKIRTAPSMSFRTLLPKSSHMPFIKLPIAVWMTSEMRSLQAKSIHMGPRISTIIEDILKVDHEINKKLDFLREELAFHFLDKDKKDDSEGKFLSVVFRDASKLDREDHTIAITVASLFTELPHKSESQIQELIALSNKTPEEWFRDYCQVVLPPVLAMYLIYGVALEAHQQNTQILFDKMGNAKMMLIRDFGDGRTWAPALRKNGYDIKAYSYPGILPTVFEDNIEPVRMFVVDACLVSHLHEIAIFLTRAFRIENNEMWCIIGEEIDHSFQVLRPRLEEKFWAEERRHFMSCPWFTRSLMSMHLQNYTNYRLQHGLDNPVLDGKTQLSNITILRNIIPAIFVMMIVMGLSIFPSPIHSHELKLVELELAESKPIESESTELEPVIVRSKKLEEISSQSANFGILGNRTIHEMPFSIKAYNAQNIEFSQSKMLGDIVKNDTSVQLTSPSGGILDSLMIRGFPIGEGNIGEITLNGVYGIAPNYQLMTQYLDKVEILKGLGVGLYGMSPNGGVGGVVNAVTKRVVARNINQLTVTWESNSQVGVNMDVNRLWKHNESDTLGIRFNGGISDGNLALHDANKNKKFYTLSIDSTKNGFRSYFDFIDQYQHVQSPNRPYIVEPNIQVPDAPKGKINIAQPGMWWTTKDQSILFRPRFDLNENVEFFANIGGSRSRVERVSEQTPKILNQNGDVLSTISRFGSKLDRQILEAGLRINFDTSSIVHELILKTSFYHDKFFMDINYGQEVRSNIYAPVKTIVAHPAALNQIPKKYSNQLSGLGLVHSAKSIDNKFEMITGLQLQNIRSKNYSSDQKITSKYNKSVLSPMLSLVYRPTPSTSLYANYMKAFSKGDIAPATAVNAGQIMSPYRSYQYEVGMKYEGPKVQSSIALFKITKPSGSINKDNLFDASSEQRNMGAELNLTIEPIEHIRLLSSASFIKAKITKSSDTNVLGKKPSGVPLTRAYVGIEYTPQMLEGLLLNAKYNYNSKQYVSKTNTQLIKSWNTLDLGAKYEISFRGRKTALNFNVNNVLDKAYWSGATSYGALSHGNRRFYSFSFTTNL